MNDDNDHTGAKSGYGNPPVEHRFKKGVSGNPRGRPRKQERSITVTQIRRDWLGLMQAPTKIRTPDGEIVVTRIEAILLRLAQKALAGHGPSIRFSLDQYDAAVRMHNKVHDFSFLEMVELEQVRQPVPRESEKHHLNFLNELRKATRRT